MWGSDFGVVGEGVVGLEGFGVVVEDGVGGGVVDHETVLEEEKVSPKFQKMKSRI